MTRRIGDGPTAAADAMALMVDRLLYNIAGARRQRAEKEAVIITLDHRATRLNLIFNAEFRGEVMPLPGKDLVSHYLTSYIYHDSDHPLAG